MTESNKAAQQARPTDTTIAKTEQNILMPAAHVKALRLQEPSIKTFITVTADHGRPYHDLVYYFGA